MGGRPSKGTKRDMRLKSNRKTGKKGTASSASPRLISRKKG